MKRIITATVAAAALTFGLSACGGQSFDEQISDAIPSANMKTAHKIADTMCDHGVMAGAFALGNASDGTSQAALALTVHQCRDTFADQMNGLTTAFSDDPDADDVLAGIAALRQIDPDDAQAVLAFAQAGDAL